MVDHDVEKVCAVVVTYCPDVEVLRALINAVSGQVGIVLIVDNTGRDESSFPDVSPQKGRVHVLAQAHNIGLAAAQNTGIEWARTHDFRHVLLMDQDSTPSDDMVPVLLKALDNLRAEQRVAAVGPAFHDLREDRVAAFVCVGHLLNRKLWCEYDHQLIACDFLISSGTLIPLDVIDAVGVMNSELFIDNVDLEWSFRVRAMGYTLYGVCAASMHHRLGDARRRLPFGLGQMVVHGPTRLYFMMRNRIRLYGMRHVPRAWVMQDLPRLVGKLVLLGVITGPRLRNLRYMFRGMADGLRGRGGACPLT